MSTCMAGDADYNGQITIDEILAAVHNALSLYGCGVPPPPCAAATKTCFVRVDGNDLKSGADANDALRSVSKAWQVARDGYTIIVGPGTYYEAVTLASGGVSPNGVQFIADTTGVRTGSAPGPVVIDATFTVAWAGFSLSGTKGSLIDGFTITGGGNGGIVIKAGDGGGSDNFAIQNCIVLNNPGDGIRILDSANALIFNNLVYGNGGTGINIAGANAGSPNAHVINNTVAGNHFRGINVGTFFAASPGAFLRNNIVQDTGAVPSIQVFTPPPPDVPRSDVGYNADFNLVHPPTYQPSTIVGHHDLFADARFVDAIQGNYHLQAKGPAIDAGDSLTSMLPLQLQLRCRTTTGGTDCDLNALDLGFHYAPDGHCQECQ